ncbi:uncharacterized protein N7500_008439, partial [Penicillium coprophilum]|uniref:uncharacterized protein n=1 Tax=Penicillium coprophilum TaxID=36646 RepID=UPI002394579E
SDPPIHYAIIYIDRDSNLRTSGERVILKNYSSIIKPLGIKYKYPKYIRKENYIELFLYILRELSNYSITTDKFKEITIYKLLRVRKIDTVIYVKKASSSAKGNKEDHSTKVVLAVIGAPKTTKDPTSILVDTLLEILSIPLKLEDINDFNYELPPGYANLFLEPIITDTPVSIENTFTKALGYYGVRIDINSYQNIASLEDYGSRATS